MYFTKFRKSNTVLLAIISIVFALQAQKIPFKGALKKIGAIQNQNAPFTIENLDLIEKGSPSDPTQKKDLEYYKVTDNKNPAEFKIRVQQLGSCGMDRQPGLQFNVALNNSGTMHGLCEDMTCYLIMQMERDNVTERKIAEATRASRDSSAVFELFLITTPKIQIKSSLKTGSMEKPLTKMYDLPFNYTPFDKKIPAPIQTVKELYQEYEIDQFKINDITGDRFLVRVQNRSCGMEKSPCLQFSFAFNGLSRETIYLTETALKNATISDNRTIIAHHELKSSAWGPGKHTYMVFIEKGSKKATLSINTKTALQPLVKTYDLPF